MRTLRVLVVLGLMAWPVGAQTGPFLAWDQIATGQTAAQVSGWQWELWVNGTGQIPLVAMVPCTGTTTFTCQIPYTALPAAARAEGTKTLELVAVPTAGIKSGKSSSFQVTVAAAPTNLRLNP